MHLIGVLVILLVFIISCKDTDLPENDTSYGIILTLNGNNINNIKFDTVNYGYTEQVPVNITVTNTGKQPLENLGISLSGKNADDFIISQNSIKNIIADENTIFTIVPKHNLNSGHYEATVTVSGKDEITAGFTIDFTVNPIALTITGVKAKERDYDSTTTVELEGGVLQGIINDDQVTFVLGFGTIDNENTGIDKLVTTNIILSGDDAVNYTLIQPVDIKVTISAHIVSINETHQTYSYNGNPQVFAISGSPSSGFSISYNQGESNITPVTAGSYNVVISRPEDNVFAAFSTTIANGLIITKADLNVNDISWPTGLEANIWLDYEKHAESVFRKLSNIPLNTFTNGGTGHFAWDEPDDILGGLGLQSHSITFTSTNENYNTISNDIEIRILLGVEMVPIPASNITPPYTFIMGTPLPEGNENERPTREVTLSGFNMGIYQVTQEQYFTVMGNNPSFQSLTNGIIPDGNEIPNKRPVEVVTWVNAIRFCNLLSELEGLEPVYTIPSTSANMRTITMNITKNGYRLPTEAEWEYACRAGTTGLRHYDDSDADLVNYAWYAINANGKLHQVGLLEPNPWGLYDMYGNLWEFCWDVFGNYPSVNETDPTGPERTTQTRIVARGGSWWEQINFSRSAVRIGELGFGEFTVGFRLVRN